MLVTPYFPDPSNYEGANRRIFQFIDLLYGLGYTLHLVPLNPLSDTGQLLNAAEGLLKSRGIVIHKPSTYFEYSEMMKSVTPVCNMLSINISL